MACSTISYAKATPSPKKITCTHPIICALAQRTIKNVVSSQQTKAMSFNSPVQRTSDPHHFEPGLKEIKGLLNAPYLITGPTELQPWERKIKTWRQKRPDLKTIYLELPRKIDDLYRSNNRHALSHFWLYPKLLCLFEKRIVTQLNLFGIPLKKHVNQHGCSYLKLDRQASRIFSRLKHRIVIVTHDALMPWLKKYSVNAHAITSSDHHQELTTTVIKKLITLLQETQNQSNIWIMEKNIPIPPLIGRQIKPNDKIINFQPQQIGHDQSPTAPLRKILKSLNMSLNR